MTFVSLLCEGQRKQLFNGEKRPDDRLQTDIKAARKAVSKVDKYSEISSSLSTDSINIGARKISA
jgi:hypothetical protein